MIRLGHPEPVSARHVLKDFDCGVEVLNSWLSRQALCNESSGASRTFLIPAGHNVAGYYSLAAGSVQRMEMPGRIRRNMPEPVPVMILGRLAVDRRWQGQGLGQGLLRDAVMRTVNVSIQVGIRALLVHAISEDAKNFYLRHGFQPSTLNEMTLMQCLADLHHLQA